MTHNHTMYVRKASAGSGKTFTLAAHYIALLLQRESYKSILAVTFTNKATAEMKERILGYLYAIGWHTSLPSTQGFMRRVREITAELGFDASMLTDDYCQTIAREQHQSVMAHYDEMRVLTIDAFLQSLLAGMVQKLDGAVGYQVELDIRQVISDAVDDLLTEGAKDTHIRNSLTRYMAEQMADEKNWDIRGGLNEIGMELYRESLQENSNRLVFDEKALSQLKDSVDWKKFIPVGFEAALDKASRWTKDDFKFGQTDVVNKIAAWKQQLKGDIAVPADAFAGFSSRLLKGMSVSISDDGSILTGSDTGSYRGPDGSAVQQELVSLIQYAATCRSHYLYFRCVTCFLNDMILMGALRDRIHDHLVASNTRLLAETANTLADALKQGDADFILEKAGIRYRHIMLDEFQDTSTLQWRNFEKLLQEILSQDGSTLIVGDIKQSIYRWRNGNWTIMRDLRDHWPHHYNDHTPQLTCNFRSEREIVRFNLDTMRILSADESDDIRAIYDEGYDGSNLGAYYRHGHDNGFVRVRCFTQTANPRESERRQQVHEAILLDMFAAIEDLLHRQVSPNQIMILFRRNKEAKMLLDVLQSVREQFPLLAATPLVSSNCFQLQFSRSVNILIAAIRWVFTEDGVAEAFLRQHAPEAGLTPDLFPVLRTLTLTDLAEYLIRECRLSGDDAISDLSYVNSFRDMLRHYVSLHGSDGLAFLRYWDDKMCENTIPAVDVRGIRLMTIHASKGLEAANVFIPFCNWAMEEDKMGSKMWCEVDQLPVGDSQKAILPVPQSRILTETPFRHDYEDEHHLQRIDNLNLLYVAFTRAAERLFVYADVADIHLRDGVKTHNEQNVGQLLASRCGLWPQLDQLFADRRIGDPDAYAEFSAGSPDWPRNEEEVHRDLDPFSFRSADEQPSVCCSSADRIEFRQSQDSRKFGWDIAAEPDAQPVLEQQALGNICHDILSTLHVYPDRDAAVRAARLAVDKAFLRGEIPTEAMRLLILPLIEDTVRHLADFFTGDWHIQCEESLLLRDEHGELEERRMDRVMWSLNRSRAIVLDYKFGQDDPRYDRQVRHYMSICRQMGAREVSGFLWIASSRHLSEVK